MCGLWKAQRAIGQCKLYSFAEVIKNSVIE